MRKPRQLDNYEQTLTNFAGVSGSMSGDTLTLNFPWITQTSNSLLRANEFARKRYRKRMAAAIAAAVMQMPLPRWETADKAIVTIIRRVNSKHGPDEDGLKGGMKDLVDCLTTPALCKPDKTGPKKGVQRVRNPHGMRLIVDDSPKHMRLIARHEYAKERGTTVIIKKVDSFD